MDAFSKAALLIDDLMPPFRCPVHGETKAELWRDFVSSGPIMTPKPCCYRIAFAVHYSFVDAWNQIPVAERPLIGNHCRAGFGEASGLGHDEVAAFRINVREFCQTTICDGYCRSHGRPLGLSVEIEHTDAGESFLIPYGSCCKEFDVAARYCIAIILQEIHDHAGPSSPCD